MRRNAGKRGRFIKFPNGRVIVFITGPYEIMARACETKKRNSLSDLLKDRRSVSTALGFVRSDIPPCLFLCLLNSQLDRSVAIMKSKLLLISALLASAITPTFGQAASPMATPNATEAFAIVPDGTHTSFQLKWDVYLPPTLGQHPAVLVIFGGRFSGGNRGDVASIASDLAAHGFVALAIDYRTDKTPNSIGQQVPVYALQPIRINRAT